MWCLLDDLRAFGIQTDQWMIAAQRADEWHKTLREGGGILHDELDRGREGQGCTTACSRVDVRNGKKQRIV